MSNTSASSPQPIKDEVKALEAKPINQTVAQIRSLVAGGAGGVCAVVVGHPFDLVKVRLQTAQPGVYSGAMDVVKRTVAREGLRRVCFSDLLFFFGDLVINDSNRACMPVSLLPWSV